MLLVIHQVDLQSTRLGIAYAVSCALEVWKSVDEGDGQQATLDCGCEGAPELCSEGEGKYNMVIRGINISIAFVALEEGGDDQLLQSRDHKDALDGQELKSRVIRPQDAASGAVDTHSAS